MAALAAACGSGGGGGGGAGGSQGSSGSGGSAGSGGTTGSSGSNGSNGSGAMGSGGGGPTCTPTAHRAKTKTCGSTNLMMDSGGPVSCSKPADCKAAGPYQTNCLGGTCTIDQCSTDADCSTDALCECATDFYGGNGYHGNICVPATCHVDSDCSGGLCAPTVGYCGTPTSYHCAKTGAAKCGSQRACSYAPPTGTFVCSAPSTCAG